MPLVSEFVTLFVQDYLGVNAGLVGKGTETGDGIVEGHVNLDGL